MKEISAELRKGYLTRLAGFELDGKAIPVYDSFAPASAPDKYILIVDQAAGDISDKDVFKNDCAITLDIVTKFIAPLMGGSITAERIADKVTQLICPMDTADQVKVNGFQVLSTKREMSRSINTDTGTIKVFRKILIFRHIIIQN